MSTFYVYLADSLDYLGAVDAADRETAGQLATVLWAVPLRVLTWRLQISDAGA